MMNHIGLAYGEKFLYHITITEKYVSRKYELLLLIAILIF